MTPRNSTLRIATAAVLLGLVAATGSARAVDELPSNLLNIELESGLLETVQEALPETQAINQDFLNPGYDPNLYLNADSQLSITFIDEGAGTRNSLGYFTYETGAFDDLTFAGIDVDGSGNISLSELDAIAGVDTGLVFANASEVGGGGSLQAGDTTVLGGGTASWDGETVTMSGGTVFAAGTNIGFWLGANTWTGSEVLGLEDSLSNPNVFYTVDFLNQENDADATYDTAVADSRHVAMMFADTGSDEVIMGFEDLVRPGGDNDFNDAVFIVRSDPVTALADNNIPVAAAPAPILGAGPPWLLALFCGRRFVRPALQFASNGRRDVAKRV